MRRRGSRIRYSLQCRKKLHELYETICDSIPFPVLVFRSAYAISFVSQYPFRNIQIILRLYSSPTEILMGFDVDSCSCGFDGKDVYMTPRCHQAITRQMNTVDMSRRSPTYELRLAKYALRGFAVEVPSLQRERIDPMIFQKPWNELRGLSKLLLLEKLKTPGISGVPLSRRCNQPIQTAFSILAILTLCGNSPY